MDSKTQEIVNNFKAKALNFVVVLKDIANVNETKSGLNIGTEVDKNEKYKKAIVVSIGTECPYEHKKIFGFSIPFLKYRIVKVGDTIMYDKHKANDLTIDAVQYKTIYYADLVMIC